MEERAQKLNRQRVIQEQISELQDELKALQTGPTS